ncbi:MAG: hypothetical protein K2X04_03095 [Burkholderiales bacterium]|nr:hypothetical protein [Burkholderiales bacterium]
MKNVTILVAMLGTICNAGFAMHSVDFSQDKYFCNGTLLTKQTVPNWLTSNCQNIRTKFAKEILSGEAPSAIDSRIADSDALDVSAPPSQIIETITFNADDGSGMKCAYVGTQLQSCKASASAKKPATSAVVSFSNESGSSSNHK